MEYNTVLLANPGLLQETLHIHHGNKNKEGNAADALEGVISKSDVDGIICSKDRLQSSKQSLLRNWPLMSAIIVYCVFQLHDTAYAEVITVSYLMHIKSEDTFTFFLMQFPIY